MLGEFEVLTNIAVNDLEESKKFYSDVLGLKLKGETPFGIMYTSGKEEGQIFIYKAPTAGSGKATICSWQVDDIAKVVTELEKHEVKFEHYDFPGAKVEGHVHIMGGMKGAWFRDPSGNILGLSQQA